MINFDDYPYTQFREALGTLLGRLSLVFLAILAGSMLGGWTATRSFEGIWVGAIGLPVLSLTSIFYGVGLVVFPVIFLYAIVSIRCEWPLFLTFICSILMWWNIHKTVHWNLYESPTAKMQQKIQGAVDQATKNAAKNKSK